MLWNWRWPEWIKPFCWSLSCPTTVSRLLTRTAQLLLAYFSVTCVWVGNQCVSPECSPPVVELSVAPVNTVPATSTVPYHYNNITLQTDCCLSASFNMKEEMLHLKYFSFLLSNRWLHPLPSPPAAIRWAVCQRIVSSHQEYLPLSHVSANDQSAGYSVELIQETAGPGEISQIWMSLFHI